MKKILVADDEKSIRDLIVEALGDIQDENRAEIIVAENGQDAINLAIEHRPNIVILDIMMPKVSGYEVCEKIRKNSFTEKSFIIMLSARGGGATEKTCERMGADRYFPKPFDPDRLFEEVSLALSRH